LAMKKFSEGPIKWITANLRRFGGHKVNSIINLVGLTLGLLVFLLVFIYVRHEFSYDKFHASNDRIFRLLKSVEISDDNYMGVNKQAVLPAPLENVLKTDIAGIESATRLMRAGTLVVEEGGHTFYEDQFYAGDEDLFKILSFEIDRSSGESILKTPKTVALSRSTALKYFGTTDAIGKEIDFTTFKPLGIFTVDAVFNDLPANSSFVFNIIFRFEDYIKIIQPTDLESWNNWNYNFLVKTTSAAARQGVEASLLDWFKINKPDDFRPENRYELELVSEMYLNPKVNFSMTARNDINRLYLLSIIALFVLAIAIINYINLTTAQSLLRAKEIGVRKVSGATKVDLFFYFLKEALFFSVTATVLAWGILSFSWPYFTDFIGKTIPLNLFGNYKLTLTLLFLPLILAVIAGSYPSFYLASLNPVKILKGAFARSSEGSLSRDMLIVFQFVISCGLLIGVIVVNNQLRFIESNDPGYSREQIISVPMADDGVRNKRDLFKNDLLTNTNIISASMATSLPHYVGMVQSRKWTSAQSAIDVSFYTVLTDEDYLKVFDIDLIAGRNLSKEIKSDRKGYIINETAAKVYGWENPVGMQFREEGGDTVNIVGVMKDIHIASYHEPVKPFRVGLSDTWAYQMIIKVSGNLPEALSHVENSYKKYTTTKMPYVYNFFDEQFSKLYKNDFQLGKLINLFSMIAMMIAAMGLYSISFQSINIRLKEIGVRKVLGAPTTKIVFLLSRKFLSLVAISFFIAAPIAWYFIGDWLNDFAYHIDQEIWPYLISLLFIILISSVTLISHTLKAARSNPVNVLRSE
jgi:putative ABC transport system permease protein